MKDKLSPRWLITILVVAFVILAVGGYWFYTAQEHQLREHAENELQAVAQLKVDQISAWRMERLGDGAILTESPFFTENVRQWFDAPSAELSEKLLARFRSLQDNYHYADVILVDTGGIVSLGLNDNDASLSDETLEAVQTALRDGQAKMTDLHLGSTGLRVQLDVIAPIFTAATPGAAPIGAIVLRIDPEEYLYPLIQSWPMIDTSAETLLVRRDGDDILFLNELRYQSGAALPLRIPLTETNVSAVKAVLGQEGVVTGTDYRGVEVLAAIQPVPDTPWYVISKVDTTEVFADWRTRAVLIMVLILGLMITVGAVGTIIWQRRRNLYYKNLLQARAAHQQAELRYQVTLMSIGDGIIATDIEGRVDLLNPTAEALTGWTNDEARGKPLEDIFNIINEETRRKVDNPVREVIREGIIVGLANHTVLISKDGIERPIADSGAPIRGEDGTIIGVVLDFRDQSEARAAEVALHKSEERYRFLFDNMREGCQIIDFDWRYLYINATAVKYSRQSEENLLGHTVMERYPGIEETTLFALLRRCMEDRTTETAEFEFTYPDGDKAWFGFAIQPVPEGLFILTLDISQRKQHEAQVQSLAKFPSENPNPVMRLDSSGIILHANDASKPFLDEWQAEPGMPAPSFWHELAHNTLVQGTTQEVDVVLQDGRVWSFSVAPIPESNYVNLYGRDVTERRRAEQDLRRTNRAFRTLSDSNQALVRAETEPELLHNVCQAIVNSGGYRFVWVGFVEHDKDRKVKPVAFAGHEAGYLEIANISWANTERGRGPVGQAIRDRAPVAIRNIETDPAFKPWREEALARGYASAIALPFLVDGEVIGALNIYAADADAFSQQEVELLMEMASDLAYGISALRTREQHQLAEQALAQERNLLRTLIDNMPDFIYAKDTEGRFLIKNRADITAMGAQSLDEVVGKTDFDYYPHELAERFHADDEQIIQSGTPLINNEEPNVDAHGTTRWILTTKIPLRNAQGNVIGLVGIGRDITERKRAEEAIRTLNDELERRVAERTAQLSRTKERVEAILNSSTDIIIFCRTNGTIDRTNPVFDEIFGYEVDESLFEPIINLISSDHKSAFVHAFNAVLEKKESERLEIAVQRRDGVTFEADITLSPVIGQNANLMGVVCIIRDISDRKQMEIELREALEAERELNALKSRFVSMISHDIRTPLSVIGSSADILRKYNDRLDDAQRIKHLAKIRSQVERMVDLLNDVLTISRADAGAIPFNPTTLDLNDYCIELTEEYRTHPDVAHTLIYESPGTHVHVFADEKLLYQALTNLINNAVKYSPDETTIRLELAPDTDKVIIRVTDNGIGIPEEDLPHLFETFHRAGNVGAVEGSGLGLAIVKRSIEAHGGTVMCESQLGVGTTFTISLPKKA